MKLINQLTSVQSSLKACRKCPNMCGTPVHGPAIKTKIMLIGQAPGIHEASRDKPFAHTAGKTLFKWLKQATQKEENELRQLIYFAAVARCFPGKALHGAGDREPTPYEIENCREHLLKEIQLLKPKFILAVGRLAIQEVLGTNVFSKNDRLDKVVGKIFKTTFLGAKTTVIPLPHPSGVSRWPQVEPGKTLLKDALNWVCECVV